MRKKFVKLFISCYLIYLLLFYLVPIIKKEPAPLSGDGLLWIHITIVTKSVNLHRQGNMNNKHLLGVLGLLPDHRDYSVMAKAAPALAVVTPRPKSWLLLFHFSIAERVVAPWLWYLIYTMGAVFLSIDKRESWLEYLPYFCLYVFYQFYHLSLLMIAKWR